MITMLCNPSFIIYVECANNYQIYFQWLHVEFNWQKVSLVQSLACLVFIWAWKHQFVAHNIFAQLKKQLALSDSKNSHSVPYGDWFYYVSCPHYLAEILMYACISIILGIKHKTGIIIFIWVLINQVIAGMMSHFWYIEKYSHTYPKNRKAVIPFIL
jgi:3-oxo-5-alpha-steroid 4-dehydrogenase 3